MLSAMEIEGLRSVMAYDPLTGLFRWKVRPSRFSRSRAGDVVGDLMPSGYRRIRYAGISVYAHRLAWAFVVGEEPRGSIDHVNGHRDDNRFANLRDVDQALNMQNTRRARGASGLLGVAICRGRFKAEIRIDGKKRHLGVFDTPEVAHAAYIEAKRIHHAGYAG